MPGQNIIELGFNVDELSAQKKQVLDLFVDLFGKLQEYDGTKFNPLGNGGLVDLKKSLADGAAAMAAFGETAQKYNAIVTEQAQKQAAAKKATDDLSASEKEHQKIVDQLAQAAAKNNAANSDAASGLAAEREALRQRNAELAAAAKLQLAESGSQGEARAQIALLIQQRERLNLTTEEGKTKQAELNEQINQYNAFIKESVSTQEQTKINIGNYSGSLSSAFDSVKEQLVGVNKQLAEMELRGKSAFNNLSQPIGFDNDRHKGSNNVTGLASGGGEQVSILNQDAEAYQKLTVQQKVLEGSLQRQTIGFKTANQEMRNVRNTLDTMTLAGLENTEAFEKLNVAYTSNEQKVKDLHREQAILTTDAPALTALTGVARGLGGAYALGAGAAQLLATGNEKLDKELNKLVAIMTFLQGLEEAVSALKQKNAIATALEESATKALNVVKSIEALIFGKTKTATEADTIAKVENVAATEASEAATVANAEAMGVMTVATEGAEVATIGLRTALVATGIGAIIVGVAILVAKIIEWSEAENKAAQNSAALAEAMEKVNEILVARIKLSDEDAEHQKKNLENALTLSGQNKQSYNDIYNIKKAQADLDQKTAEDDLKKAANTKDLGAAYRSVDGDVKELTAGLDPLLTKQQQLVDIGKIWLLVQQDKINKSEAYFQIYQKYGTDTDESDAKTQLEAVQKDIASTQKVIDEKKKLTDAYNQSVIGSNALTADQIQHINEEERKIALSTSTTEADYIKSKNAIILADDRSTLAQRLAAIQSNAEQEKKVIDANLANTLNNPQNKDSNGNYNAEATTAIQKAAEDRTKITASNQAEQYKVIVEWNDKRLGFLNDTRKNELDQDAAQQDAISKDITAGLDQRITALKANIADRTKAIEADYILQMALAKEHNQTQAEIDKIESDRQKNLASLTADTQKQIYDIAVGYGEQRLKAIQEQNKSDGAGVATSDKYNAQEDALDKSLLNQSVSYGKFIGEKKKLDQQYLLDKDRADIADDEAALTRLKASEDKEIQIKIDAAKGRLDTAKTGGDTNGVAAAQSELNGLLSAQDKYAADVMAVKKKLAADGKKLDDDSINDAVAALKFRNQKEAELEEASFNLAQELVDASYEKKVMQLERTTELQDQASEEEISAIGRSTLSTRQQAEETAIIQAQQRSRDIAAKKEERAEKVAEAKFDRDVAVAKTIWAGANAAIAAIGEYAGTPYAFAIAAVITALTAVQVATILAKPIPAYKEGIGIPGKGRHAGGMALTGEAGPERIAIPGREPFIVDEPTLINLPADSSVMPLGDGSSLVHSLGGMAITRNAEIMSRGTVRDSAAIVSALSAHAARMERAFKKSQKKIVNQINVHTNSDTGGLSADYFQSKIRGRKL